MFSLKRFFVYKFSCIWLLVAIFVFEIPVKSQKYYLFHSYTTKEGLANNSIMTINQDRYGYLWVGTDAGISRFDGYEFDNRPIPAISDNAAFVEYIDKDDTGNLIITGFMQGIHVQQSNGTFRQYLMKKKQIGKNCPNTLKTWINKRILVGQARMLDIFENGKFKRIYDCGVDRQAVISIETDRKNNIWFGGFFGLAILEANDTIYAPNFLPELKDKLIIKILFDSDGNLLAGTSQGLYKITFNDRTNWRKGYQVTQPFSELANTFINHLYFDKDKYLWIATSSIGVYKTYKSQIVETITSENGLPTNGAMCIYQDYEKNYWFGTTNGLYKLSGFDKYTFSWKGKPIENISSLEKDDFGRMWLFANTSASILSGSKITPIPLEGSPVFEGGIKMALFQGNILWIGNHNGLFSMSINSSMPDLKKLKLKANFIKAGITRLRMIHSDSDGKIWLGSDQGLFVFSKNKFLPCELKITNASKIQPSAIVKDKYGYYWLGDYSFGLYRMKLVSTENEKFVFDSIKVYKSLKPDSAFVNAWIQDLITDNEGNIWQASLYSGVYKLRIDKHGVTGAKQYSVKNGLSGNLVSSVFEDKFKRIWFATQLGADCLYKNAKGEERFLHFNKKDGFGDQVLSILPDSAVTYFTFNEGLFALENKSLTNTLHTTPKIYITNITVNGEAESAVSAFQTPVKYHHNKNYFEFEFASVSFRHETGTTYRYMLRGQDKNWQKFTDRRFTSYNALRPGNYAFMVEAKSADGVMSKSPAIFYFKILPPLYLKWWFISLVILVAIALVYALYSYRIKQLLKMERMRTQIASDLHDDIGSTLSSISILSEILGGQIDSNPRSTEMISKIGHNAKTMLESMDDIIWSVNPKNDRFENLGLRIREYAIPLFETLGVSFAIHIPEGLDGLTVPMNIRRSVYLIAKEATNNLAKYSGCNHAEIAFRIKDNVLEMEISDNGKGFDAQTPTSRNGLRNMRRRADQINSEIQIESVLNKGTVIKLRVKII